MLDKLYTLIFVTSHVVSEIHVGSTHITATTKFISHMYHTVSRALAFAVVLAA